MGWHGGENGNARRTRLAFERLRDRVRTLPPAEVKRANALVMRNELWVHKYADEFRRENWRRMHSIPRTDVHQAAFLGAVKASYTWTEARGAFTYWAWYWMRKEMQAMIAEAGPAFSPLLADARGNEILAAPGASAVAEAEAAEIAGRLREVVGSFPGPHRAAIDDWAAGVGSAETAARLGITRRYVFKLRALAMEWLRFHMGEGPEPDRGMADGRTGGDEPIGSSSRRIGGYGHG